MALPELNDRKQKLLMALVERHIRDGQPVGSRVLAESGAMQVSAATVRNVMADLEEMGILSSPHTSAGRIPTDLGYRLYVDSLLCSESLQTLSSRRLKKELTQLIDPDLSPQELVDQASRALAELTQMAGVVVVPKRDVVTLRQVEFLPLSGNRVLVILVVNQREVQNRIIHTDRAFEEAELRQAANYINQTYTGCDLAEICDGLLRTMKADKNQMDSLMQASLDVASRALEHTSDEQEGYSISGEANLLNMADDGNLEKIRDLFDAFHNKRDILHLLERSRNAEGVQIFIGHEAGYDPLEDCSLISAPWQGEADTAGVLAVVGPTRMDYERVIPTVDITSRILSAAFRNI